MSDGFSFMLALQAADHWVAEAEYAVTEHSVAEHRSTELQRIRGALQDVLLCPGHIFNRPRHVGSI
jgi:hypothetical protein